MILFILLLCVCGASAQSPNVIISQLGAKGVTEVGGTTNYAQYLPRLNSQGKLSAAMLSGAQLDVLTTSAYVIDPVYGADTTNATGQFAAPYASVNYAIQRGASNNPSFIIMGNHGAITLDTSTYAGLTNTAFYSGIFGPPSTIAAITYNASVPGAAANATILLNNITVTTLEQLNNRTLTASAYERTRISLLRSSYASVALTVDPTAVVSAYSLASPTNLLLTYAAAASGVGYTPTTPADWAQAPTNTAYALDAVAAGLRTKVGTNDSLYRLAITNIAIAYTNLPVGTLIYTAGTIYSGTNPISTATVTGAVVSIFGRDGIVVADSNDYAAFYMHTIVATSAPVGASYYENGILYLGTNAGTGGSDYAFGSTNAPLTLYTNGPEVLLGTNVDAGSVAYNNAGYSNVSSALDGLLYVAPTVSLAGGGSYELGVGITNVVLQWTLNKTVTSRLLSAPVPVEDRDQGAGGSGSYTNTDIALTSNTNYTIIVNDSTRGATGSTSVLFYNRKYYGFSDESNSIPDASVIALANKPLTSTRTVSPVTLTPTGTQYLWVCYPLSFGAASFNINTLPTGGWNVSTGAFVNASGYTNTYLKYRAPYAYGVPVMLEVQ